MLSVELGIHIIGMTSYISYILHLTSHIPDIVEHEKHNSAIWLAPQQQISRINSLTIVFWEIIKDV